MLEHTPVLLEEAVDALGPFNKTLYVDGTLGAGGHSQLLASKLQSHQILLGVDRDPVALSTAQQKLEGAKPQVILKQNTFSQLAAVLFEENLAGIDGGLLLDLGMSNLQLKNPERGFSFKGSGPLDMRMNAQDQGGLSAQEIINTWSVEDLAIMLKNCADERLAKPLAKAIVKKRPFNNTFELSQLARDLYQFHNCETYGTHPATRLFQALRMTVNNELKELETLLESLPGLLHPGAKVAIITFHSIEDRLVKQAFKKYSVGCICPPRLPICQCNHQASFKLIGKPIEPSPKEQEENPQARSAKLRIAERI